jgi:fengycin family lipopeptide synthetase D
MGESRLGQKSRYLKVEKIANIPKLKTRSAGAGRACLTLPIDDKQVQEFLRFIKQVPFSLATVLQSLWSLLLLKYNDTDEVVFLVQETSRISPVQIIKEANSDFLAIAKQVSEAKKVLWNLGPEKEERFDHLLAIEDSEQPQQTDPEDRFALCVSICCHDRLEMKLSYRKEDYDEGYLQQLGLHFQHLLQQLLQHPRANIRELHVLTPEEEHRMAHEFNQTATQLPSGMTIDQLFAEQAQRSSDHLAVVSKKGSLTYGELDHLSTQVAGYLQRKGLQKEQIVGLMTSQSPWMMVGILGILKAGGAYLPLDPHLPEERIRWILQDSGAQWLLADPAVNVSDWKVETLFLQQLCSLKNKVDCVQKRHHERNLAYVIYTSGSTGKPKGVMVEHHAVINLITWHNAYYQVTSADRSTKYAGFGFDASVWEIFPYLAAGATIYMVPDEVRYDLEALHRFFDDHKISIAFLPTQIAEQFMERDHPHLRALLVGGDRLRRIRPTSYRLVNNYGPTENTVVTTCAEVDAQETIIPIGRPIANNEVYIVDREGQLQPIGVPGELCIAGESLARGYLNQPELTSKAFVSSPKRMYKTGDRARWIPDGQIEYLGRIDQQVSIRGYRIEPGEIEQCILQQTSVKEAVVTDYLNPDEERHLVAYLVADETCRLPEVKKRLRQWLPDYMIPTYWMKLDQLPLTANGKVDKKALPTPQRRHDDAEKRQPVTATERRLIQLWQEVLNIPSIGVEDHFFHLGGHSLKANQLLLRIRKTFAVHLTFQDCFTYPTVKKMAAYIEQIEQTTEEALVCDGEQSIYPLSSEQKRMYVMQQFKEIGTTYHTPAAWLLKGTVDEERLRQTMQKIVDRHEVLRTSFQVDGENWVQQIHPHVEWEMERFQVEEEEQLAPLLEQLIRPFDLSQAPLFRMGLVQMGPKKHLLLFDFHHSIWDGVSMGQFQREFSMLYRGEERPLPRYQYKDFAVWQQRQLTTQGFQEAKAYWQDQLAAGVPTAALPTDFVRPPVQQFSGDRISFTLTKELTQACVERSAQCEVTLYMYLLTAYSILVAKYSGQSSIMVGSMVAGRFRYEWENVLGMFVNTLPLRLELEKQVSCSQLLQEVKKKVLQANQYGEYPFAELVENWGPRQRERNPFFDTAFTMQNMELTPLQLKDVEVVPYPIEHKKAMFDLSWEVTQAESLTFEVEFNTALYRAETVERMGKHLVHILEQMTADLEQSFADVELALPEEKEQILTQFNQPLPPPSIEQTIVQSFGRRAKQIPQQTAVVFEDEQITYQELDERSNQFARLLRKKGVSQEQIVSLYVSPSLEMIIAMLGILKAGGAYLPIDPALPSERVAYLLADSQSAWVLAEEGLSIPDNYAGEVLTLDQSVYRQESTAELTIETRADQLAYVIYTSGSTGKPKGVMIEHRALMNLVTWHLAYYRVTEQDRSTQFAGVGFDASVWEIFPYLVAGATIYIVPQAIRRDVEALHRFFEEKQITISFLPTQLAELFMNGKNTSLRALLVGGDRLRNAPPQTYPVFNNYGPTENTVVTTCCLVDSSAGLSIGRPIPNNQVYILNQEQQLQPIGVPGELCISGHSLARGYLHRPAVTAEKFVSNPFVEGERMYRTGDLARWLPDGKLEYLGRIDQQVKVRGYRIELGEIEACLLQHSAIDEVAVIAHEDEQQQTFLCAYYVACEPCAAQSLQQFLAQKLPDYMVPAFFEPLNELPLTANGKIDRARLPKPKKKEAVHEATAPTHPVEKLLVQIWQEVLHVAPIGVDDHFFALGGDSIKAIQVTAKLAQHDYHLSVDDLLQNPTIAEVVPFISRKAEQGEQHLITGEVPLLPIQHWFFSQLGFTAHHWNQAVMLTQPEPWDRSAIEQVMTRLVEHHDALRMIFPIERGEIQQHNRGMESPLFTIEVFDLRQEEKPLEQIRKQAKRIQKSLDIQHGPLIRLALFEREEEHHLLFVIHHLIIDGVSWRILLEDFQTGYRACLQKQEWSWLAKTCSYQRWAKELTAFANSKEFLQEIPYWQNIEKAPPPALVKDRSQVYRLQECFTAEWSLSPEETASLLGEAHRAFHTEVNDLLLSALIVAIQKWAGKKEVLISLEGHGREALSREIDLSRTIGWFTTLYPVRLSIETLAWEHVVKRVKETLRSVPRKGIGYGLAQYLTAAEHKKRLTFSLQPDLRFNYLGQFDQKIQFAGMGAESEQLGACFSPDTPMYPLDIYGLVIEQRLHLRFLYQPAAFPESSINRLIDIYRHELVTLLHFCLRQEEEVWTPSDFSAHDLDADELDQFLNELD